MCVMQPRERHLSDDAVQVSLPLLSISLLHTHTCTHTRLNCLEHRVLLYQASVAGAIRKVQTEDKLSSHTVPIRAGEIGGDERQEENKYKHSHTQRATPHSLAEVASSHFKRSTL